MPLPLIPPAIAVAGAAYRAAAAAIGSAQGPGAPAALQPSPGAAGGIGSFGDVLERTVQGGLQQIRAADTASQQGLTGQAGATEVVLAVAKAELALQTAVAVRDRVVAAYQEVMRMPI